VRLDYVYHPAFDEPGQEAAILAPMPGAEAYETQRRQIKVPEHVAPELAPLYTPLLNKDQEQHLFRKMNFLKHQANRLRGFLRLHGGCIDAPNGRTHDQASVESMERQAQAIKAQLINCNMRLLVSIAKRHAAHADHFSELLSDGNVSLISAVEKFDYSRGTKFSTYASWAIMKNYARGMVKEKRRRQHYLTGHAEWLFEAVVDTRSDERACMASEAQTRACVNRLLRLLEFLDPRERDIIRLRLGLGGNAKRMTLENIGKQLGVTKERVRQLQVRAMKKLRNLAMANSVELP
jgi:RNA polymerase sigma factor (sigma-70 family)